MIASAICSVAEIRLGGSTVGVVVVTVVGAMNGASIPGRVPHVRLAYMGRNGFQAQPCSNVCYV